MILSTFLKRVLVLDSATCLSTGLLLSIGAGTLAPLFGIDSQIVAGAGLALLPIGLFMLWLGTRQAAAPAFVYLVIVGNILWTVESFILAANTSGITPLGLAFVSVQAIAVAGLALLEWIGVRRSRAAVAKSMTA
jgi:hypothetical protein